MSQDERNTEEMDGQALSNGSLDKLSSGYIFRVPEGRFSLHVLRQGDGSRCTFRAAGTVPVARLDLCVNLVC